MRDSFQRFPSEELFQKFRNPLTPSSDRQRIFRILKMRGLDLDIISESGKPYIDKRIRIQFDEIVKRLPLRGNKNLRLEFQEVMKGRKMEDLSFDELQYILNMKFRLK